MYRPVQGGIPSAIKLPSVLRGPDPLAESQGEGGQEAGEAAGAAAQGQEFHVSYPSIGEGSKR